MKKTIKKLVEVFLAIIAVASFVLMTASNPDGSLCLPVNLACLASLAISSKLLDKMGAFKGEGHDVEA